MYERNKDNIRCMNKIKNTCANKNNHRCGGKTTEQHTQKINTRENMQREQYQIPNTKTITRTMTTQT